MKDAKKEKKAGKTESDDSLLKRARELADLSKQIRIDSLNLLAELRQKSDGHRIKQRVRKKLE